MHSCDTARARTRRFRRSTVDGSRWRLACHAPWQRRALHWVPGKAAQQAACNAWRFALTRIPAQVACRRGSRISKIEVDRYGRFYDFRCSNFTIGNVGREENCHRDVTPHGLNVSHLALRSEFTSQINRTAMSIYVDRSWFNPDTCAGKQREAHFCQTPRCRGRKGAACWAPMAAASSTPVEAHHLQTNFPISPGIASYITFRPTCLGEHVPPWSLPGAPAALEQVAWSALREACEQ